MQSRRPSPMCGAEGGTARPLAFRPGPRSHRISVGYAQPAAIALDFA